MAAPATSNEFLDLIRKSGVVEDKRLDAYLQKQEGTLPDEAGKLAGYLIRDGLLTHFQAEQIMLGKWRRFTIGKYRVLERLGSGGMGSVYLCEHKLMRRRVAVKVLPTAKAADQASLERFYREARAAAALMHPNIVHTYDVDQDESLHFLVMEFVDGASLQEIVKKSGPLDVLRACHYIHQAAVGLDHAHRAGLVHRDIKPGNILVDRSGCVKILDMGLARFFNDEEDILTKKYDESVLGTADYLSPEQAVDSHGVDIRADIYSMGATFYFLLIGKTPFGEGTVAQKLIWHQTRQPKSLSTSRTDIPTELEALLAKMLAKHPAQRFQTPWELAEALGPWTQTPIGPPPEHEMPRLSLAATGVNYGEASGTSQHASGPSSGSGVRKAWQVSAPPAPRSGSLPSAPSSPRADTKPIRDPATKPMPPAPRQEGQPKATPTPSQGFIPLPPVPSQPVPKESNNPWEKVTGEKTDLTIVLKSPGPASATRHSATGLGKTPAGQGRLIIWIVAGVLACVLLIGLILAILALGWFRDRSASGVAAAIVHKVSKDQPGALRTLDEAVKNANAGDRILLVDRELRERLTVNGNTLPANIRIEAEQGTVLWAYPDGPKKYDEPLLEVIAAKGWHFKNIEFAGANRAERLVTLTGNCPGLTFENVVLSDFRGFGMKVTNCAGLPDQPVKLLNLRARTSGKDKPEAAVAFNANPKLSPPDNRHFLIQGCTFEGQYKDRQPIQFLVKPGADIRRVGNSPPP